MTKQVMSDSMVWAVVVMFVSTVAAVTVVALFLPESRDALAIITPLLGALTGVGALIKATAAEKASTRAAEDTRAIRNGEMEAKIRRAVAEIREP